MSYSSVILADTPALYLKLDEGLDILSSTVAATAETFPTQPFQFFRLPDPDRRIAELWSRFTTATIDRAYRSYASWMIPSGNFTLECWVKFSSASATYELLFGIAGYLDSPNYASMVLFREGQKIRGRFQNTSLVEYTIESPDGQNDDTWKHVVLTYDSALGSNNLKLYIDKTVVDQANASGVVRGLGVAMSAEGPVPPALQNHRLRRRDGALRFLHHGALANPDQRTLRCGDPRDYQPDHRGLALCRRRSAGQSLHRGGPCFGLDPTHHPRSFFGLASFGADFGDHWSSWTVAALFHRRRSFLGMDRTGRRRSLLGLVGAGIAGAFRRSFFGLVGAGIAGAFRRSFSGWSVLESLELLAADHFSGGRRRKDWPPITWRAGPWRVHWPPIMSAHGPWSILRSSRRIIGRAGP